MDIKEIAVMKDLESLAGLEFPKDGSNKSLVRQVLAKLDVNKIYESQEVKDLIEKAVSLFPKYNTDKSQAIKVVAFVFKNIAPEYRTPELAKKIHSGIT